MSKANSFELLNEVATHLIKFLRLAKTADTGHHIYAFIDNFSMYRETENLSNDEHTNNLMTIMSQAYERKDMLFVADILQYELMPYLKNLKDEKT